MTQRMDGRMRPTWPTALLSVVIALVGLALAALAGPGAASAGETVARDARLGGDSDRTRFVADLSHAVAFRVFTLADPYRVIIDLPNVQFHLPDKRGQEGRGLVSAFRFGLVAAGKSRIVLDVTKPVRIDKAFTLPASSGQPARLVVDLVATDRSTFLAKVGTSLGTKPKPKPAKKREAPSLTAARPRNAKPVIVLDPGHGGVDPGAVGVDGTAEKTVVFAFAKALKAKLEATRRYKVVLTRTIDTYIPLRDRVNLARKNFGDLFISIHADSLPRRWRNKVRGATIYTLSEKASDEEARALAAKENRSDIIAGVDLPEEANDVTDILIDLAQRETKNRSLVFADTLLQELKGGVQLNKKPIRSADFLVLKAPDVPSILFELGYMSNKQDETLLKSDDWREAAATLVARAINKYFDKRMARGQ